MSDAIVGVERFESRGGSRTETCVEKYGWIPARALNQSMVPWYRRIGAAWGVLTGRYDALDWRDRR